MTSHLPPWVCCIILHTIHMVRFPHIEVPAHDTAFFVPPLPGDRCCNNVQRTLPPWACCIILHNALTCICVPVQPPTKVRAAQRACVRRRGRVPYAVRAGGRGGGSGAFRRTRRWVQNHATHPEMAICWYSVLAHAILQYQLEGLQ